MDTGPPLVRCAWTVEVTEATSWLQPATEFWGFGFGLGPSAGTSGWTAELIGPYATPTQFDVTAMSSWWGVEFRTHVFLPAALCPTVSAIKPLPTRDDDFRLGKRWVPIPEPDQLGELVDRLAALRQRLDLITWPNVPPGVDGHGIAIDRMRTLVDHWRNAFDWPTFEGKLNEFDHYLDDSGDYPLHLIHQRAANSTGVPVVLVHGWPDTFLRYRKIITPLTEAGHDVIVPSLPGFGFSGQPTDPLTIADAAERIHQSVVAFGFNRYAIHGGDFGSLMCDELIEKHSESVLGAHLTDIPFHKHFGIDRSVLSDPERQFLAKNDQWAEQAVYCTVQSAEPLTLAYGLTDSPVGLLGWIADKFDAWSDRVDADDVIAVTALTWLTGTAWSGMRFYADDFGGDFSEEADGTSEAESSTDWAAASWSAPPISDVSVAFSLFPRDLAFPPREYCERFYRVAAFNAHDHGGHFAALERPDLVTADLTAFLATLRP